MENSEHRVSLDALVRPSMIIALLSLTRISAILATLQIESALAEPITRTAALVSLVCTLMSLLYGCMYSIRFYDMRKPHKAAQWAQVMSLQLEFFFLHLIFY